jgi:uncharacterized DUF497 family protein
MADVIYNRVFIWDSEKNEANKKKHPGISFELASEVLYDEYAVELLDEENSSIGEDRYNRTGSTAIGMFNGQILTVTITYRSDFVRIISARDADPEEKEMYYESVRECLG